MSSTADYVCRGCGSPNGQRHADWCGRLGEVTAAQKAWSQPDQRLDPIGGPCLRCGLPRHAIGCRCCGECATLRTRLAEVEAERRAVVERVRETLLATRVLVDDDDVWHADTEEAMDALLGRRCRVLRALSALDQDGK